MSCLSRLPFAQRVRILCRQTSSNAHNVQKYLDTWVGSATPKNNTQNANPSRPSRPSHSAQKHVSPLLLSGSSYIMPTLRLERNDTAESISKRISLAIQECPTSPSSTVIRSMLRGKETKDSKVRWSAPIVLDLGALVPDGSPHHVPPDEGLLTEVVAALGDFGISVVGVTNAPPELEHDAVNRLGLPSILSKSRALDRQRDTTFAIKDVVQLILNRVSEEENKNETSPVSLVEESEEAEELNGCTTDQCSSCEEIDEGTENVPAMNSVTEDSDRYVEKVVGGTRVFHGNVRSGQQIAAERNQSLVIIGSVSSGGEVLADRDIFIFGNLRGRALAGLVAGEETEAARIFATSFDAELVCIGDTFTTVDNVKDFGLNRPGEAVMVTLNSDNELNFESIPLK